MALSVNKKSFRLVTYQPALIRILSELQCEKQYFWADIMKTSQYKYTENFTTKKWKFSDKNSDIFHISTQNIDCEAVLMGTHNLCFWA